MPDDSTLADRLAIRDIVDNWVLWRDARQWDRFRSLWHADGRMWATWFQGTFEEFIAVSQQGYERGARIHHMLGGTTIDLAGDRAVARSKVEIAQRGMVEGVLCDVTCWGRIYDCLEQRGGRWGIVLRRHTYEKDRLDPVTPGVAVMLDNALLGQFPEGYRHLGYLQTKAGYQVRRDLPGLDGAALAALDAAAAAWLRGEPLG
jgi:hypothetical protein